jgi:hypothetical protein
MRPLPAPPAVFAVLLGTACGVDIASEPPTVTKTFDAAATPRTPTAAPVRVPSACVPIRCVTTPGGLLHRRSKTSEFSTDGVTVYEFGRARDFDAPSFRLWRSADCALWSDEYATDKRDVYVKSPQSCGGENCGSPDYTGFYWRPLGTREPASFVMLPGGYGRDAVLAYYRWSQAGVVDGADVATFGVLWCGSSPDDPNGEVVAHDKARFYIDGEAVSSARVTERWNR